LISRYEHLEFCRKISRQNSKIAPRGVKILRLASAQGDEMKITKIDHFVLVTEDLQKCVQFYEGVLGLEHVREGGKHSLCFGSSKINIHTRAGEFAPFAARPIAGSADFCLICEDQSA